MGFILFKKVVNIFKILKIGCWTVSHLHAASLGRRDLWVQLHPEISAPLVHFLLQHPGITRPAIAGYSALEHYDCTLVLASRKCTYAS
jgi:hypothetical protein